LKYFTIDAKHWWNYLNPFWWRRRKHIEALIEWQWKREGMSKKIEKAIRRAYLYGHGSVRVNWK